MTEKPKTQNTIPPLFETITRSPVLRRQVDSHVEIKLDRPEHIDFLHAIMCQIGLPRSRQKERVFKRSNGLTSMAIEASMINIRGKLIDMPLPYGSRPRLVMVHLSTEAVRTKSRVIEVGRSIRDFMRTLGLGDDGREYCSFTKQMEALAACKLTLAVSTQDTDVTIYTQPVEKFEAWLHLSGDQQVMWPGVIELSQRFFETLCEHAVPLDRRAFYALKHSALCLDIYCWLAHRLYRIRKREGVKLSWSNLRAQFGQEYSDRKNFKKKFNEALRQVLLVYPDAKLETITGGILLKSSPPPISKSKVLIFRKSE